MADKQKRLLFIGIDGVPFSLMEKLSNNNTMPNFAKLRNGGIFRKMESTIPEVSSVSWSSIITGKNPGEHGIFGFIELESGSYKLRFPSFSDLKSPPFWKNNKENEKKYVIINVPSTFPAGELNGFLVSGFVSPNIDEAVYPKSYISELKDEGYRIDVDSSLGHNSKPALLDDLFSVLKKRKEVAVRMWKEIDWDVFMIVFTGTDRIGHFLWDAIEDDKNPLHARSMDYFKEIDNAIGDLVSRMDDEDSLLICSDHGMQLTKQTVNVNKVLLDNGILKLGDDFEKMYENIEENTKAFALDPGRIFINLAGKYPKGSVQASDYENTVAEIKSVFENLIVDSKPAIKKVLLKDEIYHGRQLENAPDIVLLANPGINLKASLAEASGKAPPPALTGHHSQDDAFLFVNGKNNDGIVPKNPNVCDIKKIMDSM